MGEAAIDDANNVVVGGAISVTAAFLYATGLCIQRAALTVAEGSPAAGCRGVCCAKHSNINWLLGLAVYGIGGLFLGTIALAFIPLSLTSSIFSSVLIFNAIVARIWLKEAVVFMDYVCYLIIIAGIAMTSAFAPRNAYKFSIHETAELFKRFGGIVFWVITVGTLAFLHVLIGCKLERKHEKNSGYKLTSSKTYRMAMCAYPIILGIYEGLAYTMVKAAQDSFDRMANGEAQTDHWLFWFGIAVCLPIMAIIILWVRRSYARFPTTQIFPLELGALTVVSVNGGLIFYREVDQASELDVVLIYIGVTMMISAMVVLVRQSRHQHRSCRRH
jgi:hypothetical protein